MIINISTATAVKTNVEITPAGVKAENKTVRSSNANAAAEKTEMITLPLLLLMLKN